MVLSDTRMVMRFRDVIFDAARRQVRRVSGEELHLTPKAFDLLALLVAAAPRVVPKAELHEHLWPGTFVSDATLVGVVKELRRVLDDHDPDFPIIRTVHRVGYALGVPLEAPGSVATVTRHWLVAEDRTIPLSDGENLIGRDPTSTVWLDDTAVSRRHARIVVELDGARLEDLRSKNGTMCREALLTTPLTLRDGDRIRIGPFRLIYRWSDAGMSTTTDIREV